MSRHFEYVCGECLERPLEENEELRLEPDDQLKESDELTWAENLENAQAELQAEYSPAHSWQNEIARIENPELRAQQEKQAERIEEQEEKLKELGESGKIGKRQAERAGENLHNQRVNASFRTGLATQNLSPEAITDQVSEAYDLLREEPILKGKERIREMIRQADPDKAEIALEKMFQDGRLTEELYQDFSNMVTLKRQGLLDSAG